MIGLGLLLTMVACDRSPDPIRAALVPDPSADTQVRVLTSVDRGAHWALHAAPVAHGVSSLHACTYDDTVWVPAVLDVREIAWIESAFPVPFVDVLRSTDLVHWTADRIRIRADTTGGVDPACVVGPEGLEMWFAEVSGREGDPAQGARPSKIWRTHWKDDHFADGVVVHEGPGLVDPAPTYVGGKLRLFLNKDGARIVEAVGDTLLPTWDGVTVPQVAELGGSRWLLAQQPRGPGMLPIAAELTAGGRAASFPLQIDGALSSCESPSLTTLGATWVLLCVEVARRGPPR
ncbi:MAG: hypothetical protein Q8P41_10915 [Pseudomonadota bacterium]|nr:hypothetical protein [Pseudomonadota bacterium]